MSDGSAVRLAQSYKLRVVAASQLWPCTVSWSIVGSLASLVLHISVTDVGEVQTHYVTFLLPKPCP